MMEVYIVSMNSISLPWRSQCSEGEGDR